MALDNKILRALGFIVKSNGIAWDTDGNSDIGSATKRPNDVHVKRMVALGGATPSAGAGVAFPATQSASADANTLDDYEEGTFTPTLTFGGGATGMTFASRAGSYVKVGRIVTVQIRITLTAKGSSTGSAEITGLPFQVSGDSPGHSIGSCWYTNMSGLVDGIVPLAGSGGTKLEMYGGGAASVAALSDASFTNTSDIMVTVSYRTSA